VAKFEFILRSSAVILSLIPTSDEPKMIAQTKSVLIAILAATLFTAGCGGNDSRVKTRLTTANFDAIQNGMSKVQVIQILGRWREEVPDTAVKSGGAPNALLHCRWMQDSTQIDITFDGDKVVSKSATGLEGSP
jgi:hypothetical protein